MRRVIVGAFVSLDGVMQAPGGPEEDPTGGFEFGGWTFPYWDEVMGEAMGESFSKPFDLLLGRKTYEIFAAHWPYTDEEPAAQFNGVTKYVATSSAAPLAWQNSVRLEGDVPDAVARLKAGDGPDLLTQGSSVLVRSLLAKGLVDELNLLVFPVLLGKGKRLFGEETMPGELALVSSKTATTGVIVSKYRPAGPVRTGSFALTEPTEAELARRERMTAED
ncbi:MAG TPA: dihydrofolate reductase family protein [Allosphingosinicella sp.]|jgi:dihydrofolate reductase|nr:dihydrofolate reductase family protein [Allosphingosinicella sp.]